MNPLIEGKKWDAVKSHVKRNKGKYLLGAAAAVGLKAKKTYDKYKTNELRSFMTGGFYS